MAKRWIAINLLLILITGLLVWRLHVSVNRFRAENDLAKIQPVRGMKEKLVQEGILPPLPPAKHYAPADFAVIPEKNVFSDTRGEGNEADSQAAAETTALAQKPILVGVTISGDQQLASIIDPVNPSPIPGRRSQIKRVGDVYQGYTITEITTEYIVLVSGTKKEIIPLHQGAKLAQGGKTPIVSTRVVSFGGGAVSGGTPVSVVSRGTGTARTAAAPVVTPAASAAGQESGVRPAPGEIRQAPSSVQPQAAQPPRQQQQQPTPNIIRTPFGDIIRPAQKE